MSQIPVTTSVDGEHYPIDSFSLAIARTWDKYDVSMIGPDARFSAYIPMRTLDASGIVLSASKLFSHDLSTWEAIRFRPVIVGGGWHIDGVSRGNFTDDHPIPRIGESMRGAVINENYTEAILDSRLATAIPNTILEMFECIIAIAAALLFAAFNSPLAKFMLPLAAIIFLVPVQWAALDLTGMNFDSTITIFALGLHSLLDRLVGER